MFRNPGIIPLTALALLFAAPVMSADLVIPANAEATARSERAQNANRFLFQFELPDNLASARIDRAFLVLDVDRGALDSDAMPLRVLPLRDDWSGAAVSTSDAVETALDTMGLSWIVQKADSGLVRVDVTAFVEDWTRSRYPNRGILVMPFEDTERVMTLRQYSGRTSVVRAELHVSFRSKPESSDVGR